MNGCERKTQIKKGKQNKIAFISKYFRAHLSHNSERRFNLKVELKTKTPSFHTRFKYTLEILQYLLQYYAFDDFKEDRCYSLKIQDLWESNNCTKNEVFH